jgi:hypothetical protein
MPKTLDKPPGIASRARINRTHKGLPRRSRTAKAGWSRERRAKQAELIRKSKPWLKSTGPRTEEGKARSASNALKHGFRSRAFIERIREERQLVRDATTIIALAKSLLRTVDARSLRGPHITLWTADPEVDSRPGLPNPPVKPL